MRAVKSKLATTQPSMVQVKLVDSRGVYFPQPEHIKYNHDVLLKAVLLYVTLTESTLVMGLLEGVGRYRE